MYDCSPKEADELPLTEGEKLTVLDAEHDWWFARNQQG